MDLLRFPRTLRRTSAEFSPTLTPLQTVSSTLAARHSFSSGGPFFPRKENPPLSFAVLASILFFSAGHHCFPTLHCNGPLLGKALCFFSLLLPPRAGAYGHANVVRASIGEDSFPSPPRFFPTNPPRLPRLRGFASYVFGSR